MKLKLDRKDQIFISNFNKFCKKSKKMFGISGDKIILREYNPKDMKKFVSRISSEKREDDEDEDKKDL
jgi:hypothetical protein